MTGSHNRK